MDTIAVYMQSLKGCPRFSKKEEARLHWHAKRGCGTSREKLILSVLPYALQLAKKFENRGVDKEDLIQFASEGVIRAVDKFKPKKGRLTTYVSWWVRQFILKGIEETRSTIRVPSHAFNKKTVEHIRQARDTAMQTAKLDGDIASMLTDMRAPDPQEEAEKADSILALERAMTRLPVRLREVLRQRCEGETLREVGEFFGITKERVRQLEQSAIDHLRDLMLGKQTELQAA